MLHTKISGIHAKCQQSSHATIILIIVRTHACTCSGKKTLGGDTKSSLFYILIRDYGALEVTDRSCWLSSSLSLSLYSFIYLRSSFFFFLLLLSSFPTYSSFFYLRCILSSLFITFRVVLRMFLLPHCSPFTYNSIYLSFS